MVNASSMTTGRRMPPRAWSPQKLVLWAALSAAGVALIPTVLAGILYLVGSQVASGIFTLPLYLLMQVVASPIAFLVINGAVLALIFGALVWAKPGQWGTGLLVAGMAALIAYVAVASDYQPPVRAREGFTMITATRPTTFYERLVKQGQEAAEVRPCTYQLLGWATDQRFYYQSTCGEAITVWAINPGSEVQASEVTSTPDHLTGDAITFDSVFEYMTFPSFDPAVHDVYHFMSFLDTEQLKQSANGRWIAVVSEHFYGPQDVILVQTED